MIDTVKLEWSGVTVNEEFHDWLISNYETPSFTTQFYDANLPWQGTKVDDSVLGVVGTKSNKTGNYLWVERSLPKFLYQADDNCRMLSIQEAREALALLVESVEAKYGEWLPDGSEVVCKRVDFYFQRHVPSSGEVFAQIARCLKNRKVALHLTGVSIPQSRWEHGRFYDKGIESGNERYADVVRHEEQLRGPKAGWYIKARTAEIEVQAAREHLNRRFEGWPSTQVEGFNLGGLVKEHSLRGAVAGFLALHPEYDLVLKQGLSSSTYYNVRNLAVEARRRAFTLDLRVPGDSWREPMVL